MSKNKRNWLIDLALFIGFLVTFFLDLTGLEGHQWLGAGVGVLALYHLIVHWKWVLAVTQRFFGRTSGQSRLFYLIDLSLLISVSVTGFSGLVISTWFNLNLTNYLLWKNLHIYSSIAGLGIILIKIATHWRWIVKTASKYFGIWRQPARSPAATPLQTSPASGSMNRREFLQLVGVASLASLISASNLLKFGQETSQEIITDQTSSAFVPDAEPASSTCTILCDRGCSYPGECRRYIDQNGNGICDLTECSQKTTGSSNSPETDPSDQIFTEQPEYDESISQNTNEECTVVCPKGCSYPGKCPDYVDLDGNNLCDLGECLVSNIFLASSQTSGGRQRRGRKQ
jgi:hypothetical protein